MTWRLRLRDRFGRRSARDPRAVDAGRHVMAALGSFGMRYGIAYLSTLKIPEGVTLNYQVIQSIGGGTDPNDWQRQAPGVKHHFIEEELPAPFATTSAGNGPKVVRAPDLGLNAGQAAPRLEDMSLEEVEGFLIRKTLARCDGNARKAAEQLGLSRSAFYRRLERYGL